MSSTTLTETKLQTCGQEQSRPILIVEDDPTQAEVLAHRLSGQGYRAIHAATGRQGMQLSREQSPALVLLDLRLPDVDGFDICRQLDEHPDTCHIPIVILSGMERPDIIRRSRAAGCSYFVRKPYDPNVLLTIVRQAIQEVEGWDP